MASIAVAPQVHSEQQDQPALLAVGTGNKCKLAAVSAVQTTMGSLLGQYTISSHKVDSGIKDQPDSLELTIEGAQNRARASFEQAKATASPSSKILALGIESGLFFTKVDNRCFDVCVCSSTTDGINFNQGMSCAFEIPPGRKICGGKRNGFITSQQCSRAHHQPEIGGGRRFNWDFEPRQSDKATIH